MAAHLGKVNMFVLQYISLLIPFILFWKNKISARAVQIFLILYGFEWIRTLIYYARIREEKGEDWLRLAIILGVVALLNFATALVFRTKTMKERYELKEVLLFLQPREEN
jgi:ABC-type transport system involved in Fe-S cluster assembly fused permease/ATPase subunit